jgi:hypothetical protein
MIDLNNKTDVIWISQILKMSQSHLTKNTGNLKVEIENVVRDMDKIIGGN